MLFRKKGAQLGADLSIMGAGYSKNGSVAARFSQTMPVSFDREMEAEFRRQSLFTVITSSCVRGKYRLKFAVANETDNLDVMEQMLEVSALASQGLRTQLLDMSIRCSIWEHGSNHR